MIAHYHRVSEYPHLGHDELDSHPRTRFRRRSSGGRHRTTRECARFDMAAAESRGDAIGRRAEHAEDRRAALLAHDQRSHLRCPDPRRPDQSHAPFAGEAYDGGECLYGQAAGLGWRRRRDYLYMPWILDSVPTILNVTKADRGRGMDFRNRRHSRSCVACDLDPRENGSM